MPYSFFSKTQHLSSIFPYQQMIWHLKVTRGCFLGNSDYGEIDFLHQSSITTYQTLSHL